MKALLAPVVATFVLATVSPNAQAQHAGHGDHEATAVQPKKPVSTPAKRTPVEPAEIDHAAMGHDVSPAQSTGHDGTDHHRPADTRATHHDASHAPAGAASHSAARAARDLPADAAPRTPIPVLTDADRAAAFPPGLHGHTAHDRRIHSYWLADRLEWQDSGERTLGWEGVAWIGGDVHRLWLRSEGEAAEGEVEHGDIEVLYGRGVAAWWDVVAGVRQDVGHGPSRMWAAIGVQGLAPYKFEVEATGYVGRGGRTAATLEAEYDTLITSRLILQWQVEASLHGQRDAAAGIGSGLSTVEAGARLRYEVTRRFAPYVGLQFERAFGETADLRRDDGDPVRDTRLVAGLRFWF